MKFTSKMIMSCLPLDQKPVELGELYFDVSMTFADFKRELSYSTFEKSIEELSHEQCLVVFRNKAGFISPVVVATNHGFTKYGTK